MPIQMRFTPAKGEKVVLGGKRYFTLGWRDDDADMRGAFVYFGSIRPVETASVSAIIDPGLPPHLVQAFELHLASLFSYYGAKTGYELAKRPAILIGFNGNDPGQGYGGDVLPDGIAFSFRGQIWERADPDIVRRALHLIAHESAHLWNSGRFDSADNEQAPWMHEGGAEAFAWLAMRDLEMLGEDGFRRTIQNALNHCVGDRGIHHDTLQAALMRQQFDLSYSCGGIMNMLVDAALSDSGGLYTFWRALFREAKKAGNHYSLEQYFSTVEHLTNSPRLANVLRRIWRGPLVNAAETITGELRHLGVVVSQGTPSPEDSLTYARQAMTILAAQDCGGSINFRTESDRFYVDGAPRCRSLNKDGFIVTALAGEPIKNNGVALYAAVRERCAAKQSVEATLAGGSPSSLSLSCPRDFPVPAPYWVVAQWPKHAQSSGGTAEAASGGS